MSARTTLIRNARIWLAGKPDRRWMLFDTVTGRVLDVGQGEPDHVEGSDVIDMEDAR